MADKEKRVPENVPGPYYVDNSCISCQLCNDRAPDHFRMNENNMNSYVYKQPETDSEIRNCEEALSSCPASAIGNDG
ncbi:ferredoxin [Methanolobus sp. WCC4]|uniref:ferredoxin n=1 Tax=Methanolobus sp. WCC4 TaxID=3125784 RepID=UPI0030F7C464